MTFDEQRLHGGDPTYAPGISWSGKHAFWRCPAKYKGYTPASISLKLPGHVGDEFQPERARLCREYTRDMLRWWNSQEQSNPDFGTWAYVFHRYRTDEFSPYHDVKANTRTGTYDPLCDRWVKAIGTLPVAVMTFQTAKTIEKRMKENGRSLDHIRRTFRMLRTVARYGAMVPVDPACKEVAFTLSQMRFKAPPKRQVAATREDVYRIVAASDASGTRAFSVGIMLQFELMLRAVDVRGQWLDGPGGIERSGKHWRDGLTWDMFAPDLSGFTKTISKTEKSLPEPYHFDLTLLPEIRERLAALRPERAIGPVIVSERTRMPYDTSSWSQLWAKHRKAAGVDPSVWAMDLRASGVTEAKRLGVRTEIARDAMQHTQGSTTEGYMRDRSGAVAKVVELRQGKNVGGTN